MTSFANGNAKNIKGLGKFKNEKFIGEVAFDEDGDLVDDEVTHLSFYEAEYGGKKKSSLGMNKSGAMIAIPMIGYS